MAPCLGHRSGTSRHVPFGFFQSLRSRHPVVCRRLPPPLPGIGLPWPCCALRRRHSEPFLAPTLGAAPPVPQHGVSVLPLFGGVL
ncbi:MAG: hypothetical protein BJ554DRAFT_6964 [Olpidium bornovanus]|uniref:Uncharacterized protein n=1 Tax=Olpidium bornovanus TaxID=278681 RepID=A0A8H7ZX76_9FUNG|nr:MAG: hypothetical protein BJ554DRAFT_6964 [Olpidium bornovanus]